MKRVFLRSAICSESKLQTARGRFGFENYFWNRARTVCCHCWKQTGGEAAPMRRIAVNDSAVLGYTLTFGE